MCKGVKWIYFSAPCAAPFSAEHHKTASDTVEGPKIVYVFADLGRGGGGFKQNKKKCLQHGGFKIVHVL